MPFLTDRAQDLKDLRELMILNILLEPDGSDFPDSSDSDTSTSSTEDSDVYSSDSDDDVFMAEDPMSELCELYTLAHSDQNSEDRTTCLKSKEFALKFLHNLSLSSFRQITRLDKESFWTLVRMIEDHPVFHNQSNRDQIAVSLQLAATLDRLGNCGNGAALKRSGILWGISTGSIVKFMHRCLEALEAALADVVKWPDQKEKNRISGEFAKMGFRGCVGLVDGTLLPLSQRPKMDCEVYFDRKKRYSLNMQVICDDRKKILHMFTGLPGSCADTTSLRSSPMWQYREDPRTFSNGEYLLGDSCYHGMPHVVSAFKYSTAARDADKEAFNLCVAKTIEPNEHCIGVLKSRWHYLKEIKTQLKEGPPTSIWMIRQIEMCIRLHNFVHNLHDEWTKEDDDIIVEKDPLDGDQENSEVVNENNSESTPLQTRVMAECLEVNRRPGGLLV